MVASHRAAPELPVCAHRCCCCCCRACSVRCCVISAAGGRLFAASLTASRYSLASLMLTIRQSARQHQPLCAALSPFHFPRPFPSLHRGLNTSTIGPNTPTLLSAKRRVAHYSPQRIGCSTTSTMIACVDSPHCCSGRVLGVALGMVRSQSIGLAARNYWPGQYHPGSRARLPPPRRRRPPVPFLPRCSPLCRSSEPRSSHVTKKNFHCRTYPLAAPLTIASLTCYITLSLHHSLAASPTH